MKRIVLWMGVLAAVWMISACAAVESKDETAPVILLHGNNPFYVEEGQTYVEPGASATDNLLGIVDVSISGEVNTSQPGTYTITYTASDAAGNTATETRTVIVRKDYTRLRYTPVRYPETGLIDDEAVIYYPQEAIRPSMPVVVFLEGGGAEPHIDDYRGMMAYLAAQGYYVIGAEQGESYDSSFGAAIVDRRIAAAIDEYGLQVDKLAVMGHSQGGGQAFYVMKHLQDAGYGTGGSLTLSIDGWFAFGMNKADLAALRGRVTFLMMHGTAGTGTDPRIHLTIWDLALNTERTFMTLPENDHMYVAGSLEDLTHHKQDILRVVGALTDDAFQNTDTGYKALPEEYKSSYQAIFNALKPYDTYSGDCAGAHYDANSTLKNNDIDYCTMGQD